MCVGGRGNQAAQSWEQLFCRVVLFVEYLAEGIRNGDEDMTRKTKLNECFKDLLCSLFSFFFFAHF